MAQKINAMLNDLKNHFWLLSLSWVRVFFYGVFIVFHILNKSSEAEALIPIALGGFAILLIVQLYRHIYEDYFTWQKLVTNLIEITYLSIMTYLNKGTNDFEYIAVLFFIHIFSFFLNYEKLEAALLLTIYQCVVIGLYLNGIVGVTFLFQFLLGMLLLSLFYVFQGYVYFKQYNKLLQIRDHKMFEVELIKAFNDLFQHSLSTQHLLQLVQTLILTKTKYPGGLVYKKGPKQKLKILSFGLMLSDEENNWRKINKFEEKSIHFLRINNIKYPLGHITNLSGPLREYCFLPLEHSDVKYDSANLNVIWYLSRATELLEEKVLLERANNEFANMMSEGVNNTLKINSLKFIDETILKIALKIAALTTGAQQTYIIELKGENSVPHVLSLVNASSTNPFICIDKSREVLFLLAQGLEKTLVINDMKTLDDIILEEYNETDIKNIIIEPLKIQDKLTGYMVLQNKINSEQFNEADITIVNYLCKELVDYIEKRDFKYFNYEQSIKMVLSSLNMQIPYIESHSIKVAQIAQKIGKTLSLPDDEIHILYLAGIAHDIGMAGIDKRLLLKDGPLTMVEYMQVQQHSKLASKILAPMITDDKILMAIEQHHEYWDGRGYPYGIKGEQINLYARILSVADSYNAMISSRNHRSAYKKSYAIEQLINGAGKQYDPMIVDAFLSALNEESGNNLASNLKWVQNISNEATSAAKWLNEEQVNNN